MGAVRPGTGAAGTARDVVTRSLIVSLGVTACVGGAMMAGTFGGLTAFAPAGSAWPRFPRVLDLTAHLVAIFLGLRHGRPHRLGSGAPARSGLGGVAASRSASTC